MNVRTSSGKLPWPGFQAHAGRFDANPMCASHIRQKCRGRTHPVPGSTILIGGIIQGKQEHRCTCPPGFAGGTYHISRVFNAVTRRELSETNGKVLEKISLRKDRDSGQFCFRILCFHDPPIFERPSSESIFRLAGQSIYLEAREAAGVSFEWALGLWRRDPPQAACRYRRRKAVR